MTFQGKKRLQGAGSGDGEWDSKWDRTSVLQKAGSYSSEVI